MNILFTALESTKEILQARGKERLDAIVSTFERA